MNLNDRQAEAVKNIFGPLMVIAGPGTGKTELLSARAGEILKRTDTLAQSILCLTYTDAGTAAMQKRLIERLGPDGYKIPVHTFHSFAADIMSRYSQYFYNGATLGIADKITSHQVLTGIIDQLDYDNPFKTMYNDKYTGLSSIQAAISEIKKSGLSLSELGDIALAVGGTIDQAEPLLRDVFDATVNKAMLPQLQAIVSQLADISEDQVIDVVPTYISTLIESINNTIIESSEHPKVTPPLTAWKKLWLTKDSNGQLILKARKHLDKLQAALPIIEQYQKALAELELQDYDDMILTLIQAIEGNPDLLYELQEQYLFIMVDEFQDTNLAQMRIIGNLANNPVHEGKPNLMVVGDDDQAIYSFQGAEVGNILTFRDHYPASKEIVLVENYRSPKRLLDFAAEVIKQSDERLIHHIPGLDKTLDAKSAPANALVQINSYDERAQELQSIAESVSKLIADGTPASEIAIIGARHADLAAMLPYLVKLDIPLNYEKRENILDSPPIVQVLQLASLIQFVDAGRIDKANELLSQVLAHPAWQIPASVLWKISLNSYKQKELWLESIATYPETKPFFDWLIETSQLAKSMPLELMLDRLVGHNQPEDSSYVSPLKDYFFAGQSEHDYRYIDHLDSLLALREALRTHYTDASQLTIANLTDYIELARITDTHITRVRRINSGDGGVNLLSGHGSKGLEFNYVFITNAVDSRWGEKVRGNNRGLNYPENLRLKPNTGSYNERLRLFFVAMTRAKQQLFINYAKQSDSGKDQFMAGFLSVDDTIDQRDIELESEAAILDQAETSWYQPLVDFEPKTLQDALADRLADYKLSATDLNAYLDVSRGGPQKFLINNILRFPSAMSASAAYGSAIHNSIQAAHAVIAAGKPPLSKEAIISDFEQRMAKNPLDQQELTDKIQRGRDSLTAFLDAKYASFNKNQAAEAGFYNQNVMVGQAKLTGSLDLIEIDPASKQIQITDYKTGKTFNSFDKGSGYDKVKAIHYAQQLVFYNILIAKSRDYSKYQVASSALQFVEPDKAGQVLDLELHVTDEDIDRTTRLIQAVWQRIMNCDFPDTSHYPEDAAGIEQFENYLLDNTDA